MKILELDEPLGATKAEMCLTAKSGLHTVLETTVKAVCLLKEEKLKE